MSRRQERPVGPAPNKESKEKPVPEKALIDVDSLCKATETLPDVLNKEPDLACVLIAVGFLDRCLAALLHRHFVKGSTADNLLDYARGVLGTYASRVNLCYCLGLITKGMKQNLDVMGEIRNRFGHTHVIVDLGRRDIKELCDQLTCPKVHHHVVFGGDPDPNPDPFHMVKEPRHRFSLVAVFLANRLLLTGLSTVHRERAIEGWE